MMTTEPYEPTGMEKTRWPRFSQRALLVVGGGVLVVLALWTLLWPRVGLPRVWEIARMRVDVYGLGGDNRRAVFDVPEDHWSDVLDALSSARRDRNPGKCEGRGRLDITLQDGGKLEASLFVSSRGLSVAVGTSSENRRYYRGADEARLMRILKEAYEAANTTKGVLN
jgi:hypothetical protein